MTECWSEMLRPTAGRLLRKLQPDLMQEQGVVCLLRTVCRRWFQYGYKHRVISKKALISLVNCKRRLRFCHRKLHWTIQIQWSSVNFNDKTEIVIRHTIKFRSPWWLGNKLLYISDVLGMYVLLWCGYTGPWRGKYEHWKIYFSIRWQFLVCYCQTLLKSPVDMSCFG